MSDKMLSNDEVLVEAVARDLLDFLAENAPEVKAVPYDVLSLGDKDALARGARSILSSIQSHLNDRQARNEKGLCLTYWHGVEHEETT